MFSSLIQAAQIRREEKLRAEKERLMAEEDPEKQRKMEVKIFSCQTFPTELTSLNNSPAKTKFDFFMH